MSIRSLVLAAPLLGVIGASPGIAIAQSEGDEPAPEDVAAQLIERAKVAYSLDEPEPERPVDCVEAEDDTLIIVCAPVEDDPARFRGPSRLDRGDDSHLSWDGGAPNLEPSYPGVVVARGCFIPPCPPPPVYYIDVAALPEAPPGSDADRIARGLAPRGSRYDEGEAMANSQESGAEGSPAGPVIVAEAAEGSDRPPES